MNITHAKPAIAPVTAQPIYNSVASPLPVWGFSAQQAWQMSGLVLAANAATDTLCTGIAVWSVAALT